MILQKQDISRTFKITHFNPFKCFQSMMIPITILDTPSDLVDEGPDDNDPNVDHEDNHGGDDLEVDYIDAEHSR